MNNLAPPPPHPSTLAYCTIIEVSGKGVVESSCRRISLVRNEYSEFGKKKKQKTKRETYYRTNEKQALRHFLKNKYTVGQNYLTPTLEFIYCIILLKSLMRRKFLYCKRGRLFSVAGMHGPNCYSSRIK